MTYEEWKKRKDAGEDLKVGTKSNYKVQSVLTSNRYKTVRPTLVKKEEKSFWDKYIDPLATRALNVADIAGGYTRTAALQGLSKLRELVGKDALYTPQQFKDSYKRVGTSTYKGGEGGVTFSDTFRKLNLPIWTQAPALAADVGLDPINLLSLGAPIMAKSLTKGGKIMQGISRADKTIDTMKLANRVNKLRKPIKAVNYLDKATVAALGVKGLGNIAKGNIATGALQTGFGLLGMRGAADDARILKNLGGYSDMLKKLPKNKMVKYTKYLNDLPARRIKPDKFLALPEPKYKQDWILYRSNTRKVPTWEVNTKPVDILNTPLLSESKKSGYKIPQWEVNTKSIKQYKPDVLFDIPGTKKAVEVTKEVPIDYYSKNIVKNKNRVSKTIPGFEEYSKYINTKPRTSVITGRELSLNPAEKLVRGYADEKNVYTKLLKKVFPNTNVPDKYNFAGAENVRTNIAKARFDEAQDSLIKLAKEDKALGINSKDVYDYMIAKHTPEFNARQLGDDALMQIDLENNKALKTISTLKEQLGDKFADLEMQASKRFSKIGSAVDEAFINGAIDAETYKNINGISKELDLSSYIDDIKSSIREGKSFDWNNIEGAIPDETKRFKYYIPFQREVQDTGSIYNKPYKDTLSYNGAKGVHGLQTGVHSTDRILNPDIQIKNFYMQSIPQQEQMKVGRAFARLVDDFPRVLGEIAEGITEQAAYKLPASQVFKVVDDTGKIRLFKIKNDDLAKALLDIQPWEYSKMAEYLEPLVKVMEKYIKPKTRAISKIYTNYNPSFLIKNPMKDVQQAIMNMAAEMENAPKQISGKFPQHWAEGTKAVFDMAMGRNTPLAAEAKRLKKLGVFTDFLHFEDINKMEEKWDKVLERIEAGKSIKPELTKVFRAAAEVSENSTRYAAFKNAKMKGLSDLQAANVALEAGLNFSKHGNSPFARMTRAVYAFSNPAMLEVHRALKTMKSPEAMARVMMFLAAPAGAIYDWNREVAGKNWRDAHTQDELNSYWIVELEPESGAYISIPKPFWYTSILSYLDAADAKATGADNANGMMQNAMNVTLNNLIPVLGDRLGESKKMKSIASWSPSAIAPVVQIGTNKNYWGSNLYPGDKWNDPNAMWSKTEKSLFPIVNKMFGELVSPEVLKHVIKQYAPIGKNTIDFIGMFSELSTLAEKNPTTLQKMSTMPLLKDYIKTRKPYKRLRNDVYDFKSKTKDGGGTQAEYKTILDRIRNSNYDKDITKELLRAIKTSKTYMKSTKTKQKKVDKRRQARPSLSEILTSSYQGFKK